MSAKSATGLSALSVQKWIIDSDIENQLRLRTLRERLANRSLSHGSIELYLKCHSLIAIGWDRNQAFSGCLSLLRVDLSGCPKLESIPRMTFADCEHLVSVVFGEHSSITNLGAGAFQHCYALTSITLPDKLEVIEELAFSRCTSLERVVCNKSLKTIGNNAFQLCSSLKSITLPDKLKVIEVMDFTDCNSVERVICNKNLKTICINAFGGCSKLEDVQLASSLISFGRGPFADCDHLIELAAAAGFPSNTFSTIDEFGTVNHGDGVEPYLINQFERSKRKRYVLLALMRFKNAIHAHDGTEEEKVAAAKKHHLRPPSMPHPSCFTCKAKRRPTRMLRLCAGCNKSYFCNKQCQIDGWKKHKVACKRARKRKKLDYSKGKFLVGELLSVAMRGAGHKGVLGTILSYL